jgi:eukaryotic-like serine/threonine-protein kinase
LSGTAADTDLASGPAPRALAEGMAIASRIGRFVVLDRIGSGGMGVVLAAYDPELDRRVALKLVRPDRWSSRDTRARGRALAEARAMAKVSHPNVVPVYEIGGLDEGLYVAMELVQGTSVRDWIAQPRAWQQTVEVFVQLARGLAAVHKAGLVHRDVKPDNLMIRDDGRAQLLDFGIARALDDFGDELGVRSSEGPLAAEPATEHGKLVGTPSYMSPEQFLGQAADARSDQWALCVSLFEALYRVRPFEGPTLVELSAAVTEDPVPPPPKDARVPGRVHAVIMRGLAKAPSERWPSIRELADALDEPRVRPQRARRIGLGLGAIAVLGGVLAWRRAGTPSCDDAGAPIDAVWNEARSRELGGAFVAAAPSWGGEAWTRTAAIVDGYAGAWAEQRRDACAAAHVSGLQSSTVLDLRNYCLERSLEQLGVLLDELAHVDTDGVERAFEAALARTDLQACRDVVGLVEGAAPPTVEQAEPVAAGRRTLALAEAKYLLGDIDEAKRLVEVARPEIEQLGYLPLLVDVELHSSVVDAQLGDHARAVTHAERAYFAARTAGDERNAASAAAMLAAEVAMLRAHVDEGLRWLALAELELGPDGPASIRAHIASARGNVLYDAGRYADALASFEQERELAASSDGPEAARELDESTADSNIAVVLTELGRPSEAIEHARAAVALEERVYGADHPALAITLNGLGHALERHGDYREAAAVMRRALDIRERAFGPDHPAVATSLTGLASTTEAFDAALARELCQRAIAIIERAHGADHPDAAVCLNLIGLTLIDAGDPGPAREALQRALDILDRALGPEHPQVAAALSNLASAELRAGALAQAELHLRRSIAILERDEGANIGFAFDHLGETLERSDRAEEALAAYERALAYQERDEAAPENLASPAFGIARMLAVLGREPARARALALRARLDNTRAQLPRTKSIASIDAWLAAHPER